MEWIILVACLLSGYVASAADLFQGFFRQSGPCFGVSKLPKACNRSLADSFRSRYLKSYSNEPETLVYLFTPSEPDKAESLHLCGGNLPADSNYDPDADTEIFIHGWLDGVCRTGWMREMKEQLFLRGDYNVILVDWTWGNTPDYKLASDNCKVVGEQVGFIISNIMRQTGAGREKFHVIGHSLGAIAGGYASRAVSKGKIRRITALDPAYAPFGKAPPRQRLTYQDASVVDVIHSNSALCFAIGIGDERPMGHASFYPNGGLQQTSCHIYMLEALLKMDFLYGLASLEPRLCSHLQSTQYYKLSINSNNCQYVGIATGSYENLVDNSFNISNVKWAVMGMDFENYHKRGSRRRKYFLKTEDFCPYYDDSYLQGRRFPFRTNCTT